MATSSRTAILARIRNAVKGRVAPDLRRGHDSFVFPDSISTVEAFIRNLTAVNGTGKLFPSIDKVGLHLESFILQRNWKQIIVPEPKLQELLGQPVNVKLAMNASLYADATITTCEALVADLGSILVSTGLTGSRQSFIATPVHIVLASVDQIMPTLDAAMKQLKDKYKDNLPSTIITISGPSRTADIEKTLILGAHGPKELHVLISEKAF